MEERLSIAQSRRILPCLQRYRTVGDDAAGGNQVRHVFPVLFDRSATCPDHALRTAKSVSSALPNGVACAKGNSAKGRGGRSAIESISWLRPKYRGICRARRCSGCDRFL